MKNGLHVIFEIIKKEFHQIGQDRRMLIVSLAVPVIQVLLLGYAATTDVKNASIVVCDLDRTPQSRALIDDFTKSNYFTWTYAVERVEEVDPFIDAAKATAALVIPAGYSERLLRRETVQVQMIMDGTNANNASVLLGYAQRIVAEHSQRILLTSLEKLPGLAAVPVIPEPRVWFNPDLKSSNFMVPGVVALVLMIITMTLTSLGIVKEKEAGTLEQILVTPIRPYQLIIGKLVPFTLIGFIDISIVMAIAHYWFEVPLRGSLPLLFGLSGLFILTTLGLGLFVSTIAKSQQQAMLIAQFFFFMPFLFLSGFAFPISNMPVVIQYITYAIPLRYFLEIVRGVFLKGSTIAELWPQAAALLGIGVLILTVSILRFQKRIG